MAKDDEPDRILGGALKCPVDPVPPGGGNVGPVPGLGNRRPSPPSRPVTGSGAVAVGVLRADRSPMMAPGNGTDFPVICVGGSAGGLDAYIRLLRHLPSTTGAAIVIVNHLRKVATQLHKILPSCTSMPVELITQGLRIEPNHVFIIPANHDLHVHAGGFDLRPISKPRGSTDVITVFLRSLTEHWYGQLIAVIVSGYDGDGAAALCGIREVGGITIAQQPRTAAHPDMPGSAIASGCIDFILPPEEIAHKISEVSRVAVARPPPAE